MRFDTPVYFQKITAGAYNPDTGDYGPDTVDEEKKWAAVTDAGESTQRLIYGEVREGSKVIRLQLPQNNPFDRIRIDEKLYKVDMTRHPSRKYVFIVHEVM